MVRLVQCLCPAKHCITAMPYDDSKPPCADPIDMLRTWVLDQVAKGKAHVYCVICGSNKPFTYLDTETAFETMEAAMPALLAMEKQQAEERRLIARLRQRAARQ